MMEQEISLLFNWNNMLQIKLRFNSVYFIPVR